MSEQPILALENVSKTFHSDAGKVAAVLPVSFSIAYGEIVALVGESGSGKSTLGRIALGLLPPDSGRVLLAGRSLRDMPSRELRSVRTAMQPIFQDSTASLNPRRPVRELLGQALRRDKAMAEARSVELLEQVGLRPGRDYMVRYPHELSGGQRQRLAVARALAMEPALLIADEPLSGADVSIRGQILNLLLDIREARRIAILMITHDISVARAFADRVAVMRKGEIVEMGPANDVLTNPRHPYTQRLVAAVPSLRLIESSAAGLKGRAAAN